MGKQRARAHDQPPRSLAVGRRAQGRGVVRGGGGRERGVDRDRRGQRRERLLRVHRLGGARRAQRAAEHHRGGRAHVGAHDGARADRARGRAAGGPQPALRAARHRLALPLRGRLRGAAPGRRERAHRRRALLAAVRLGRAAHLRRVGPQAGRARLRRQGQARERARALGGLPVLLGRAHRARRALPRGRGDLLLGDARRHHRARLRDGRRPGGLRARLRRRAVRVRGRRHPDQPRRDLRAGLRADRQRSWRSSPF